MKTLQDVFEYGYENKDFYITRYCLLKGVGIDKITEICTWDITESEKDELLSLEVSNSSAEKLEELIKSITTKKVGLKRKMFKTLYNILCSKNVSVPIIETIACNVWGNTNEALSVKHKILEIPITPANIIYQLGIKSSTLMEKAISHPNCPDKLLKSFVKLLERSQKALSWSVGTKNYDYYYKNSIIGKYETKCEKGLIPKERQEKIQSMRNIADILG